MAGRDETLPDPQSSQGPPIDGGTVSLISEVARGFARVLPPGRCCERNRRGGSRAAAQHDASQREDGPLRIPRELRVAIGFDEHAPGRLPVPQR
jgi:hypothetical protein